ncbi:MAG: hypothetical protein HQL37_08835 [Alphaproteobacteria bacterium]|nr:hypothetical protein [Alphaproteobacteria bacterium]
MPLLLGAGAWGIVILGVIATAATYEYLAKDLQHNGTDPKTSETPLRAILSTIKAAINAG